jgi:hypothetical protein
MTKLAATLAALATATFLAAAPATADNASQPALGNIQLAQADVNVRIGTTPSRTVVKKKVIVRKPVVKKRVIVTTPAVRSSAVVVAPGRNCRTVTTRKTVNGRVVVSKVRRCN